MPLDRANAQRLSAEPVQRRSGNDLRGDLRHRPGYPAVPEEVGARGEFPLNQTAIGAGSIPSEDRGIEGR